MNKEEYKKHLAKSKENTEKASTPATTEKDPRFWSPTIIDKDTKISSAIIRPLACPMGDDVNYVFNTSHYVKTPAKNYSFQCSRNHTHRACPICEAYYSEDQGSRDNNLKPKHSYIFNIYVVDDKSNPENNGKVFLYKCPKTLWKKIQAAKDSEYEEDKVDDIFDMWEGASILVRTCEKGGFVNYDNSVIRPKEALFKELDENDPKYMSIASQSYSLKEFSDSKNCLSDAEVKEILSKATGLVSTSQEKSPENFARKHDVISKDEGATSTKEFKSKVPEVASEDDFFDDMD